MKMQPWQVCNPYTLVLLKLCNEFTDYGFLDFFSKMAAGKWWLFSNLPTLDFVIGFLCVFMLFVQLSLSVASSLTCIWLERLGQMFTTLWTMCQKKTSHLETFAIFYYMAAHILKASTTESTKRSSIMTTKLCHICA